MKLLIRLFIFILVTVAISSCSVNNGFIQKRKYQKGYHLSMKKKTKTVDYIRSDKFQLFKNNELSEAIPSKDEFRPAAPAILKTSSSIAEEDQISTKKVIAKNETTHVLKYKAKKNHDIKNGIKNITSPSFNNNSNATSQKPNSDDMLLLLYILAVLIPFVAVGIVTDWDVTDVIINLLLCILCYIPGVIHAFIKIRDNY